MRLTTNAALRVVALTVSVSVGLGVACSDSTSTLEPISPMERLDSAPPHAKVEAVVESGRQYTEEREACAAHDALRQPFWGELHVHTALSMDAYLWDVRGTPDQAFEFAKAKPSLLPPLDADGKMTRSTRLERPLDFVSLTDHASFMGEVSLCTRPESVVYDSESCRAYRGEIPAPGDSRIGEFANRLGMLSQALSQDSEVPQRKRALCGDDLSLCIEAMDSAWRELQAATERHYDRSSACTFTTFHGYEYTATPALSKVHHNVIFRNANVPETVTAWVDEADVYGLFKDLQSKCLDAGNGCDVLTIPHNSNLSNGRMFAGPGADLSLDEERELAQLRQDIERLIEITQIKGDSECRNGMYEVLGSADEFCDYEEWRPAGTKDCEGGTGSGALAGMGCVDRTDYVRTALIAGLAEERRLGVNPYKMGIVGATDAHNANPGDVEEYSYQGWRGSADAEVATRVSGGVTPAISNAASSPGGIAGVWAEENSRDSIFDAMVRRETFGTSGPRMTARFFGGWDYPAELCDDAELVAKGYAGGVPMGGDLRERPEGAGAPRFVVSALRDTGIRLHPGGRLQRAQIVKGWVDDDDHFNQAVYDVAGGPNDADVDLDTCQPTGSGGRDSLCSVWTDPDFDSGRAAVYYLRVLENPSCRWNQYQCNSLPEAERPEGCTKPRVPRTIQERLWTSPIWYQG